MSGLGQETVGPPDYPLCPIGNFNFEKRDTRQSCGMMHEWHWVTSGELSGANRQDANATEPAAYTELLTGR